MPRRSNVAAASPGDAARGAASARPASRQQEVGAAARAETRRRLLEAAIVEFTEHGYTRATVAAIARRAHVTVQTLYLAWGSKLALLEAFLADSLSAQRGTDVVGPGRAVMLAPLREAGDDPVLLVSAVATLFRRICERTGVAWRLYQDAATTHPEVAEQWHRMHMLRRETFEQIISRIAPDALRPGLSSDDAIDTAWAIASPESYALFVQHRGYTLDQYETWLRRTLMVTLLDSEHRGSDG